MAQKLFMTVMEVAEELNVSRSYAYNVIRRMNKELKAANCIIMKGKVDRKYFHEQIYGTRTKKEVGINGSI